MRSRPTTAYEELRAGEPGAEFMHLLKRTIAAVARLRRFPPPDRGQWNDDALQDVAADFIVSQRFEWVNLEATDEYSLKRVLGVAIRHHLTDQARSSERGKLARALRQLLSRLDGVSTVPGSPEGSDELWADLAFTGADPWAGDPEELMEAAYTVQEVDVRRISTGGRGRQRFPPGTDDILKAVLARAGGPLQLGALLELMLERFPPLVPTTIGRLPEGPLPGGAPSGEEVVLAGQIADDLLQKQKLVVPFVGTDHSDREVADQVGLSKSTVNRERRAVAGLLRTALGGIENPEAVTGELIRICQVVRWPGTPEAGSSSSPLVEGPK